ncbi:MAG: hypothetical protein V3T70_01985 [Phycisphaerae bacterium]
MRRRCRMVCLLTLTASAGCDTLAPLPATPEQLDQGLIVLYPGASSAPIESVAFIAALRNAGIARAIEPVAWGIPWRNVLNVINYEYSRAWAVDEAARLAAYMETYPDRPVTLVGYSAGAGAAILVAEALPPDRPVERVILLGAFVSADYDLTAMLDRTQDGAISYHSLLDLASIDLALVLGTFDRRFVVPAGVIGFVTDDPRLLQVPWDPSMAVFGNTGEHLDILLNVVWLTEYLAPWVLGTHTGPDVP